MKGTASIKFTWNELLKLKEIAPRWLKARVVNALSMMEKRKQREGERREERKEYLRDYLREWRKKKKAEANGKSGNGLSAVSRSRSVGDDAPKKRVGSPRSKPRSLASATPSTKRRARGSA